MTIEGEPHICKYCGATTNQPDDQCYARYRHTGKIGVGFLVYTVNVTGKPPKA